MTTAQIESRAAPNGVALSDINIQIELRYCIIPEFLEDVGYTTWRRKHISKVLASTANYVDVTDATYTFSHMKEIFIQPDWNAPLKYIGEDPVEVLKSKAETTAGKPTGYYIESDGNAVQRIGFNRPADQQYTVWMTFDFHIKWTDDSSSRDLDIFIPQHFQYGLIEGLRRQIYHDRSGIEDPRYLKAAEEFEKWKARARKSPEMARTDHYKYAR